MMLPVSCPYVTLISMTSLLVSGPVLSYTRNISAVSDTTWTPGQVSVSSEPMTCMAGKQNFSVT